MLPCLCELLAKLATNSSPPPPLSSEGENRSGRAEKTKHIIYYGVKNTQQATSPHHLTVLHNRTKKSLAANYPPLALGLLTSAKF